MEKNFNVDSFIKKLLSVSGKKQMQVKLKEKDMLTLCSKVKTIFAEQPMLIELEAPLKVCGKIHRF